eukprot:gene13013-17445_t
MRSIILSIVCLISYFLLLNGKANVNTCVKASSYLSTFGAGQTEGSCMNCDPATNKCAFGCQSAIDKLYWKCDSVCLPYGYYFDPDNSLGDCWAEQKPSIKIMAERCGCNSSYSVKQATLFASMIIISFTTILIWFT